MTKDADLVKSRCARYRPLLDAIFEEFGSAGFMIMPDEAMDFLDEVLVGLLNTEAQAEPRKAAPGVRPPHVIASMRQAHNYAVDLFYRTYYEMPGKGRPPLPLERLDKVLALRRKGLSHAQIAKELRQAKDATRKQVKQVEKLWNEKSGEIQRLAAKLNLIPPTSNQDIDSH